MAKEADLRTVSMPCSRENSGGGGVWKEEKESMEKSVSDVFRREERVSILFLLECEGVLDVIHLHGRIVASMMIGRFSWRILAIMRGIATDPGPTGSL